MTLRTWALWISLALGLALAAWGVQAPAPRPADAPADAFSAGRAMADVQRFGATDHPIGSAAEAQVRAGLLTRMTALGLKPQVFQGVGIDVFKARPDAMSAATVRDVIGVLPGRDPAAPAVLVMAHYDSVPNSPGAADDTAGVASLLETARLLAAGGLHPRDVIFMTTDGEEAGLLGAEAFFHADPLAAHVGVVVNLETRGDAGRTAMFETGPQDANLIRLYGSAVSRPFANSLTSFLYHHLPNDTDFTRAIQYGLSGLNFAFIDDQLAYHTPLATPEHLSRQSLQHMGDQAVAVVRGLADAPALPGPAPDLVYFDLFGRSLLTYPPALGWLVAGGAAVALALAWLGFRRRPLRAGGSRPAGVPAGVAAALTATLASALVLHLAARLLDSAGYAGGYHLFGAFDLLFAGAVGLAFATTALIYAGAVRGRGALGLAAAALLAALASLVHGLDPMSWGLAIVLAALGFAALRRPLPRPAAWLGALLVMVVIALAVQAAAPLTAALFAWPVLAGALAATTAAFMPARGSRIAMVIAAAAAVLSLGLLGGVAQAMFTAIGPELPEVLALFVLLLLASFAPLLADAAAGVATPALAAAIGVFAAAALAVVAFGQGTASRPALTESYYLAGYNTGRDLRIDPLRRLDPWSRVTLRQDGGAIAHASLPPLAVEPVWSAPAPVRPITPPMATLTRTDGRIRLHAAATGGGRALTLLLRSLGGLDKVTVQGRSAAVRAKPGAWAEILYSAPPAGGVDVDIAAPPGAPVEAIVGEVRDGWPPGAAPPPKPASLMAWRDSDTTLAIARATLR